MMREFSLRRKSTHTFSQTLIRVSGVVFALVVVFLLFLPSVRGVFIPLFEPLFKVQTGAASAFDSVIDVSTPKSVLWERLQILEAERDHILAQAQSLRVLSDENAALKELLGRRVYNHTILASVISRPTKTAYDTFIIDVGEPEISVGDIILAEGVIGIGKVTEVYPGAALASLFSSPGSEIEALVGPERIPVIAQGQGGGSFIAQFPREEHVEEGYTVILPGITPHVFATVESIEVTSADPFITVRFSNPINLQTITWVSVLTDISEIPTLRRDVGTSTQDIEMD